MGIPSGRFNERNHELFTCTVCLDVAEDPVVVTGCEHIFCRKCVEHNRVVKCPTCQQPFKNPKWGEIKGFTQRSYLDLRVKCLNQSCGQVLDANSFTTHDLNCPVTFEFCKECGHKSRRGSENEHSCIQVIKDHYEGKLKQLKEEAVKMRGEMEKKLAENEKQVRKEMEQKMRLEMNKKLNEMKKEMATMKEQLDGAEEKLKKERQRYSLPTSTPLSSGVKCDAAFKRGEVYYECRTCALNVCIYLCEKCFNAGNHAGHSFYEKKSVGFGEYCDCGIENSIKEGHVYCNLHKHSPT